MMNNEPQSIADGRDMYGEIQQAMLSGDGSRSAARWLCYAVAPVDYVKSTKGTASRDLLLSYNRAQAAVRSGNSGCTKDLVDDVRTDEKLPNLEVRKARNLTLPKQAKDAR